MSYFKVLGLEKEPFSTSPDPDFFYESQEHHAAIIRLLIEFRLRRGCSLILGDIGTGKTTLSRKLFQMLKERENIVFHMILDPTYTTEKIFLKSLTKTFNIELKTANPDVLDIKEAIKDYLFKMGVEEDKTVVLLVDEAQKLNSASLEILRVLLNYETNEFKLLQLLLMGQLELLPRLKEMQNLWDRVSLKYLLNPLDEKETVELIDYRLKKAGHNGVRPFFSSEAIKEIFHYTEGYPRRIAMICHKALKNLVMENKPVVDVEIVKKIILEEIQYQ